MGINKSTLEVTNSWQLTMKNILRKEYIFTCPQGLGALLRSPTWNSWTVTLSWKQVFKLSFRERAGPAHMKKEAEKVPVTVLVLVLPIVLFYRAAQWLRHYPGSWEQVGLLLPHPQLYLPYYINNIDEEWTQATTRIHVVPFSERVPCFCLLSLSGPVNLKFCFFHGGPAVQKAVDNAPSPE